MSKRFKRICLIILIAIYVIPIGPVQRMDDGGTKEYLSLTWRLQNLKTLHSENGVDGYILGKRLYILGICFYDNASFVPNEQ